MDEIIEDTTNKYANLQNFKGNRKKRAKPLKFKEKARIVAAAESGGDKDIIAKEAGVTKQTVYNLVENLRKSKNLTVRQKNFLDSWDEKKLEMSDDMAALSEFIYKNITVRDIEKCSLPQKVTSMAILQDKALLMRGEATSRIAFDGLSDEELRKIVTGDKSIDAEVVEQNP